MDRMSTVSEIYFPMDGWRTHELVVVKLIPVTSALIPLHISSFPLSDVGTL